jgi:acetylornithine deacetylase/succinyl-diaminopimelate desuccinylase-like protein
VTCVGERGNVLGFTLPVDLMRGIDHQWLTELSSWLEIPSVSADPAHRDDVRRAGEWVLDFVRSAGGEGGLLDWNGQSLVVGEFRASSSAATAPTVLCYGHFDVQPADPLELWESPPFEPVVRDGWLYARGAADDKGQFFMLLKAAQQFARTGDLPVNVRFLCDGEEETIGTSVVEYLARDERGADACVIFDSGFHRRGIPVFNVATRGLCYVHLRVATGARDLHSGMFGGTAANATHALLSSLAEVLPRNGRLPDALRAGIAAPSDQELADWQALQPGGEVLAEQGAQPSDPTAAAEFYLRTWAEPAVDVHGLVSGSPVVLKTIVPSVAEANVSLRLAPGQDVETIADVFEGMLRAGAPAGAEIEITRLALSPPGLVDPRSEVVEIGLDAFERVLGVRPLLVRGGGTLPIVPALGARGIPTILTGFDLPEGNAHAPNERIALDLLPLGVACARELFRGLGELRRKL